MKIDAYSFGSMTIDGKVFDADLIVFPDRIRAHWWRIEGHALAVEDLKEVIDFQPKILLVGKGASGCMEIPAATKNALQAKRIKLIEGNTDRVYPIFNEALEKAEKVVGAFHLTC